MNTVACDEKKAKWIKTAKVIFWTETGLFLLAMVSGGIAMIMRAAPNVEGITHLGYPVYLLTILGVAKLLGGVAILQNRSSTLKDWGYAGYVFILLGAASSHAFSGDPFVKILAPLVIALLVLMAHRQWKTGWM